MITLLDISPLKIENVVSYEIVVESGIKLAYIVYKDDGSPTISTDWNIRLPLSQSDRTQLCNCCGVSWSTSFLRCPICGRAHSSAVDSVAESAKHPKIKLFYYNHTNIKDKLVNIGGRLCLILGKFEALAADMDLFRNVFLLAFYDFYQPQYSASNKFNVLQYSYYDTSSGNLFTDDRLDQINLMLKRETVEHFFSITPRWNVEKICDIFVKRSI